jgi:hypothetical protein
MGNRCSRSGRSSRYPVLSIHRETSTWPYHFITVRVKISLKGNSWKLWFWNRVPWYPGRTWNQTIIYHCRPISLKTDTWYYWSGCGRLYCSTHQSCLWAWAPSSPAWPHLSILAIVQCSIRLLYLSPLR